MISKKFKANNDTLDSATQKEKQSEFDKLFWDFVKDEKELYEEILNRVINKTAIENTRIYIKNNGITNGIKGVKDINDAVEIALNEMMNIFLEKHKTITNKYSGINTKIHVEGSNG